MGNNQKKIEQESEGVRSLRLLGLDAQIGRPLVGRVVDGRQLLAEDFLELCGQHARPLLRGFESLPPSHPKYDAIRGSLVGKVMGYLEPPKV